jgi:hypothetical protein
MGCGSFRTRCHLLTSLRREPCQSDQAKAQAQASFTVLFIHQSEMLVLMRDRFNLTTSNRYCCANLHVFPFGSNLALVISRDTGSTRLLSHSAVELLVNSQGFKTLRQHATDNCLRRKLAAINILLSRKLPSFLGKALCQLSDYVQQHDEYFVSPRAAKALEHQLADMADLGYMVSEGECLDQVALTMPPERPHVIRSVGVVTKDRPETLLRCLTSFVNNSIHYDRDTSFTIFDDSLDSEARVQNRAALNNFERISSKITFMYAGLEEKTQFRANLVKLGEVPPDVIDFALFDPNRCGQSYGANLNSLLLHNVGTMAIALDDDVVCQTAKSIDYQPGLMVSSSYDPTECRFYHDRHAALQAVEFTEVDFISLHEIMLGRRVSDCIGDAKNKEMIDISFAGPNFVSSLLARSGLVEVTMSGFIGDCGTIIPRWFALDGPSRERVLKSAHSYRSAFASREIARSVRCNLITDGPFFMNCAAGLDNRALLPPFFPVMRNMDGIFAVTLRKCSPDSYLGHIPWMVLHDPPERRFYSAQMVQDLIGFRISDILIVAINSFAVNFTLDSVGALHALGKHLREIASLPIGDFERWLHQQLCQQMSFAVEWLDRELQRRRDLPAYWHDDVSSYLIGIQEFMTRPECTVARDLLEWRSVAEARLMTRNLIRQYGELLIWWPELCSLCTTLKSTGVMLTQGVSKSG